MKALFSHILVKGQKVRFTKRALANDHIPARGGVFTVIRIESNPYHWNHGKQITLQEIKWWKPPSWLLEPADDS